MQVTPPEATPQRRDLRVAALILLAACLLEWLDFDRSIARLLFYHPAAHGWIGNGPGAWWARDLLHSGGRWLVRCVAAAALACWALSFVLHQLASWRRQALFVFAGMVLVTATAGLLKVLTGVDCPWDLSGFGGERPYVTLFGNRPDYLPAARCFPGAHSSSGFALMGIYLALRDDCARLARIALGVALIVGTLFAIGQQARGAHFLSHDLTSVALSWWILATLHARMFGVGTRVAPAVAEAEPV
jgi:membrane-associated PAP2 superfamily phosphatase